MILIAAIFAFSKVSDQPSNKTYRNSGTLTQFDSTRSSKYQAQTDNQARVTVDVIPKQLGVKEEKNVFAVSLNTHSVELDFDFTKIMILKDDLNNVYPAIEWTGNRGWHHVSGDIIFPKINQQAKSVELQIKGINGVDRLFRWELK